MTSKVLRVAVRILAVLLLAVATTALAQDQPRRLHLSGLINDYTPTTTVKPMGPWEMHGTWTLTLNREFDKADFSAALTMEEGDYWLSQNTGDVDDPGARSQHTHHITMKDATVSDDTSACLPPDSPADTVRFVVTGMASVTANGNNAPFAPNGELSPLLVCVAGGTDIEFSNVTLLFSKPASGHFGSQGIHGVVRKVKDGWHDDAR
jgi:hypothetical protein